MQSVKKTYNLFLDDIREPIHAFAYTRLDIFLKEDWLIVRDYDQFVETIDMKWEIHQAFPELIAFDHDLADAHYGADVDTNFDEKTGYDCAKWLADFCTDNELKLPKWFCHSANPAGRDNINIFLNNFKKHQNKS